MPVRGKISWGSGTNVKSATTTKCVRIVSGMVKFLAVTQLVIKLKNTQHIPPSPLPTHNGFNEVSFTPVFDSNSMDGHSQRGFCGNSSKYNLSLDSSRMDDEHRLIARYAARLAVQNQTVNRAVSESSLSFDSSRAQRELISQLESKNREILREIQRLRRQQELEGNVMTETEENPALVTELRALRLRKDELENHLQNLQDSRRQLLIQLEGLMKMLKNHQTSPRSTPNSSPRSSKSPPLSNVIPATSKSAPPTPVLTNDGLSSLGGDVRSAFGNLGISSNASLVGSGNTSSLGRSLRNDLLVAADSVTNAMSTLVRELNSEGSEEEPDIRRPLEMGDDWAPSMSYYG
ncbi:hypothetical protein RUM44_002370 [Polyplax serrata]|uniref:Dystrobrevin n=1 Tax=Polyplax serrata TaxID=468196 RepID=A0ABR1AMN5_POLSC